jgi:AraC family transcriptional regulator, arabinose operon regulatory protein
MAARTVTPHRTAPAPITGHFRTRDDYAVWRPHGTDGYLLVLTVSGHGRFASADGAQFETEAGDLVLVRPHSYDDYRTPAGGRWELLWVQFIPRGDWHDLLDWPIEWPGIHRLKGGNEMLPLMRRLHAIATGPDPLRDRLVMNMLEALLLACDRLNPVRQHRQTDSRILHVLEQVSAKLDQSIAVDSLAAAANLSPSRLAHLFRAEIGVPVMHYVETRRIERATQLLRVTALSIKQIAEQVGFDSPFYFSLRFKKATGLSPTAYRGRGDGEQRRLSALEPGVRQSLDELALGEHEDDEHR